MYVCDVIRICSLRPAPAPRDDGRGDREVAPGTRGVAVEGRDLSPSLRA